MAKQQRDQAEHLEYCAQQVLDRLAAQDAVWADFIRIARDENHWTAFQIVGNWCAYVLENQLHTVVTRNEAFQPGAAPPPAEFECVRCGKPQKAEFPGQRACTTPRCDLTPDSRSARPLAPPIDDKDELPDLPA